MELQSPCTSSVEEEVEALYLARHRPTQHHPNAYFITSSNTCCLQHITCRNCQRVANENEIFSRAMKKDDFYEQTRFTSTPNNKYSSYNYVLEDKTSRTYAQNRLRDLSTCEYPMETDNLNNASACINIKADVHNYSSTNVSSQKEFTKKRNQQSNQTKTRQIIPDNIKIDNCRKHSLDFIASAQEEDDTLSSRLESVSIDCDSYSDNKNVANISSNVDRYKLPDNYYHHNGPGSMKHNLSFPGTSKGKHISVDNFKHISPRNVKHSFTNKYGFEENIYEEVSDSSSTSNNQDTCGLQHSVISLNQSMLEEEVRRVESKHLKILGELNLSMEALLMPDGESSDSEKDKEGTRIDDLIGPTDELLSPATYNPLTDLDSGFSGSSSGASYIGSLQAKVESERPKSSQSFLRPSLSISNSNHNLRQVVYDSKSVKIIGINHNSDNLNPTHFRDSRNFPAASTGDTTNSSGFWKKKAWKKLPGFSSSNNIDKTGLSGLLVKSTSRSKSSPRSPTSNASSQTTEVCETCLKQRC